MTLSLNAELTVPHAAELREQLLAALDAAPAGLCLDLGEVTAIDSAGIQLLLAARHSLAEAGQALHIAPASAVVHEAFQVFGLQGLLGATPARVPAGETLP